MPVSFSQFGNFQSPATSGLLRISSNRRLVTAACVSLLLHVLLLAALDRRNSASDETLSSAPWSRGLSVTFHLPQSAAADSDQDLVEKRQMKIDARLFKRTPSEHIDGGNESTSIPTQITAPFSASGPGANASELASSPAVDIDAARRIARQMARAQGGDPAQQPLRQAPSAIERETPLGQAISRSVRSDCRNAYAGAGLFALPLLIRDAVTDRGCKW